MRRPCPELPVGTENRPTARLGRNKLRSNVDPITNEHAPLISEELHSIIESNKEQLNAAIVCVAPPSPSPLPPAPGSPGLAAQV